MCSNICHNMTGVLQSNCSQISNFPANTAVQPLIWNTAFADKIDARNSQVRKNILECRRLKPGWRRCASVLHRSWAAQSVCGYISLLWLVTQNGQHFVSKNRLSLLIIALVGKSFFVGTICLSGDASSLHDVLLMLRWLTDDLWKKKRRCCKLIWTGKNQYSPSVNGVSKYPFCCDSRRLKCCPA